ncbi:MAG TPA: hypothetical protein VKE98_21285 [Gemmataceae bacterium]|nr:hypothetical protein [Gemmataceae bacterium]
MLIDSTHKRWLIGTVLAGTLAVGLYGWLARTASREVTGGSMVGLWYGIGGSLLMVFAGLLAAHRKLLRWPMIPARSWWLKGHIWLGLLSGVLILCHSGFRWGGTLERLLWTVFALTLLTGILGLWLQQFLPRTLASRVPQETPFEQIPHVARVLVQRADALIDSLCADALLDEGTRAKLRLAFESDIRPFLARPPGREKTGVDLAGLQALPAGMQSQLAQLERWCQERRRLDEQERLHRWLHGWLLVHVPLSIALLVLGLAHAVGSLYF